MNHIILFDLDGTLTDPKEGITKSVQHALQAYGIDEPDLDKLCPFIGRRCRTVLKNITDSAKRRRAKRSAISTNILQNRECLKIKFIRESGRC